MRDHASTPFIACLVVFCVAWLGGCGDDGGSNNDGSAGTRASGDTTFTAIYDDILFTRCSDQICHGGGGGKLKFSTRDATYAALIDTPAAGESCDKSSLVRVKKGEPEQSLLYLKLTASPPCGVRMPLGGELDDSDIARIKTWIEDGAKDD